jgi:hypothetical protein
LRDASAKPRAERAKALCAEKAEQFGDCRQGTGLAVDQANHEFRIAELRIACRQYRKMSRCWLRAVTRAPVAAQTFGHVLEAG